MTSPFSNYNLAWFGCLAACLACGAPRAPGPVVAPAADATSSEVSPPSQVNPPTAVEQAVKPTEKAPQGASIQQTVDLVAKRDLWPLQPDRAETLLQELGPVHRKEPMAHALSLEGGPSGALARFSVSYFSDDKGVWAFSVANFAFTEADLQGLYATVKGQLTERLGKAEWTQQGEELPSVEWSLGKSMKLLLARSPNQGENALVISVAEPEGEEE
jgi:hypothetical protein